MKTLNKGYGDFNVDLLIPHEQNPNRGDLDVIDESIEVNGFYGAVILRDHPTQAGKYQILVGEHRWRVATAKGATAIPGILVEADDVEAARIMLVDNEAAKRSTYDVDRLTQVLASLKTLDGTGFDLAALDEFEAEREANEPADEPPAAPEYGVVIVVEDEQQQKELCEELQERGLNARMATI